MTRTRESLPPGLGMYILILAFISHNLMNALHYVRYAYFEITWCQYLQESGIAEEIDK